MTTQAQAIQIARDAIQANHDFHVENDDYGGYNESEMHETNRKALAAIDAAAVQEAPAVQLANDLPEWLGHLGVELTDKQCDVIRLWRLYMLTPPSDQPAQPPAPLPQGEQCPSGWKLVPEQPTRGMLTAAWNAAYTDSQWTFSGQDEQYIAAYGAMLEAAPGAPAQPVAAQPAEKECRHCGWMCRPNATPEKSFYPLEQPAQLESKDAERYGYLLDCDYIAARRYLPNLGETEYKAKLRVKHDAAIAASKSNGSE